MSLCDCLLEISPYVNKEGVFSMNIYKNSEIILASVLKFNGVFVVTVNKHSEIIPSFNDVIIKLKHLNADYIRVYGLISVLLTKWDQSTHNSYTFKATKDIVKY